MLLRAVVIASLAALCVFRAFAGVETLDSIHANLPWFANTKEYQSLLVDNLPELATEEASRVDAGLKKFFSKENEKYLQCESDILASLSQILLESGVSANRRTIRGALRLARASNIIDDVALTPLLQVLDAVDPMPKKLESDEDYAELERSVFAYAQVAPIRANEEARKQERETEAKCKLEESKKPEEQNAEFIASCKNFYYARLSGQCSIPAFRETQKRILEEKGSTPTHKIKTKSVFAKLDELVQSNTFSGVRAEYYKRLYDADMQSHTMTWMDFALIVSAKKDTFAKSEALYEEVPKYLADRMKKTGVSRRVYFYSRFNATQIEALVAIYKRFTDFVSEKNKWQASLVDADSEELKYKLEIPYASQYCFSILIFKEIIASQKNSDIFKMQVSFDDIATAVIETGYVAPDMVKAVLKTDDIWNPEKKGLQKVLDAVKRFGGPALIFVPPPYNMVSSLAMTLVQTIKKKDDNECKSLAINPIFDPYANDGGNHP